MALNQRTDEIILVHPHKECYSVILKNELPSLKETWMNLTCLPGRSQSGKATQCTIPVLWRSGKGTFIKAVRRSAAAGGRGEDGGQGQGVPHSGETVS